MPKSARKRVRAYLAYAAEHFPDIPVIIKLHGTEISLTTTDLQALLRSEKQARRSAAAQRDYHALWEAEIKDRRQVQSNLTTALTEQTRYRKLAEDRGRDLRAKLLIAEQKAEGRTATGRTAPDIEKLAEDIIPMFITAFTGPVWK